MFTFLYLVIILNYTAYIVYYNYDNKYKNKSKIYDNIKHNEIINKNRYEVLTEISRGFDEKIDTLFTMINHINTEIDTINKKLLNTQHEIKDINNNPNLHNEFVNKVIFDKKLLVISDRIHILEDDEIWRKNNFKTSSGKIPTTVSKWYSLEHKK